MAIKDKTKDRVRRFTFNLHHWIDKGITKETLLHDFTNKWDVDYMILGAEITNDNSIPHLHGYIEFRNPATWTQVHERFIAVCGYVSDLRVSEGDAESNKTYCSKHDNSPLEYGSFTKKMAFDDLAVNVVKLLSEGVPLLAILTNNPAYAQYIVRNYTNLLKIESSIIMNRYDMIEKDSDK